MRRKNAKKRVVVANNKFNSVTAEKLIKYIMKDGKIETARRIFYQACDIVEEKLKKASESDETKSAKGAVEALEEAIENVRPLMQVKSRRIGGATFPVPMEVTYEKSKSFALKWMVEAIKARALKDASLDLAQVIVDSVNKTGFAMAKKIEMNKQAEAHRAWASFRW